MFLVCNEKQGFYIGLQRRQAMNILSKHPTNYQQSDFPKYRLNWDAVNYLAISKLERIGVKNPSQSQIDLMEAILRISLKKLRH
jgi:hypothetical protein